jgi:PIN domain nuclease of toxin-antitoxin system
MLIFILQNEQDNVHCDVQILLDDYSNTLYVSSVAVSELLLLFRLGKLNSKSPYKNEHTIVNAIKNLGIETVYFNENHFLQYENLQIAENHKDMNDHLIISQAISDKIALVSSDFKFSSYKNQKLDFIFNKR